MQGAHQGGARNELAAPAPRGNGGGGEPAARRGAVRWTVPWAAAATVALIAAVLWLREPSLPYLVVCAGATVIALGIALLALAALRRRAAREGAAQGSAAARRAASGGAARWAVVSACMAGVFCVAVAPAQRAIDRIDGAWPSYAGAVQRRSAEVLARVLRTAARSLRTRAERALDAPAGTTAAFRHLGSLVRDGGEQGVVLYRGGVAEAWAGRVRVRPDTTPGRAFAAPANSFYVTLQAAATRGDRRAVATAVVHAEPPADRIADPLDRSIAVRAGVSGFDFAPATEVATDSAGQVRFAPAGEALFVATPRALRQGEARLRAVERGRTRGAPLLALAIVFFVAALWRRPAPLAQRLGALAVPLAAIGLVPLNAFSNASRLVDPSFYFAPFGGPFTGSAAALGLTSAVALLGLLAVLRSRLPLRSRWPAVVAVLVVAGLGPFLLRDLARGIVLPPWGASAPLWLAWELTIFLAATCVLLAGASAGRAALGARRGLSPWVAPALAAVAALLAPVLWEAPGRWPWWYPAPWVGAIGALAITRRARGFVLTAAAVAGCGAAALAWGATARKRVELAEADVAGLSVSDPYARTLLDRFAAQLAAEDAPSTRADLLQSYVTSDLAAAGYPVALAVWTVDGGAVATLAPTPAARRGGELAPFVDSVRAAGAPAIRQAPGVPGVELQLAVPYADGHVTTVVVGPRTRLIPADDPSAALLGLAPESAREPPYDLSLTAADPRDTALLHARDDDERWRREGNELHGDWLVRTAEGPARAHAEVELRSIDALARRGALVVLLDLAVVAVLWTMAAVADGGLGRWVRGRQRTWRRSFRARLTLVLFGFFVVPAVVFVAWSYRQLQEDDRQSRALLVRETLRSVVAAGDVERLAAAGARLDAPLLLYARGSLAAASDTLYDALAPFGRFLHPDVALSLALGEEVTASRVEPLGPVGTLVGYVPARRPDGERVVLASPARTSEVALDRRRRDLGVLVLFSAALGALGALALSGAAARQLSRPIGALRAAALAVARGEREPVPPGEPPSEFVPVFSAFRRMAADLRASQSALEEAQRRTAAVLRNVASGVVAVSARGEVSLANPRAALLLGCALPPGTALSCIGSPEVEERVRAFVAGSTDEEEFDVELGRLQLHGRLTRLGGRGSGEANGAAAPGGAAAGGGATVVLTLDDVTELARAQRVLAWGEMARQVAHEIKNPLTPIRLGVQHLRRARHNPRVDFDSVLEQNVGRILAEIDRLDEIARAFSRYGTAPGDRAPTTPTDVAAIVRDVVALERLGHEGAAAADGGVTWELSGAEAPAVAEARAEELREVLLNVLENARLAHARTVRVRVSRDGALDGGTPAAAGGRHVRIAVTDDGEGISPDVLPRIFEPHFSTRTSGSGLGLAVSRRIIDGWGGRIEVRSERGMGTEVAITLRGAVAGESDGPPRRQSV